MEETLDLWARARDSLPQDVRDWLSKVESSDAPSSGMTSQQQIDHLITLTNKKQNEIEAKPSKLAVKLGSHRWELRKYFDNIIKWLDKFKTIGDVAASSDPLDATLPWAAFRLVLQALVAEQEHSDAVVQLLTAIPRFLFSGRVLEVVYTRNTMQIGELMNKEALDQQGLDNLHQELVKLYVGVLTTLEFTYSILSKSKARRKMVAVFKSSEPVDILKELEAQHNKVLDHGEACGRICSHKLSSQSLTLLGEIRSSTRALSDRLSRVLIRMDEEERVRTLQAISGILFQAHHNEIKRKRTKGTGEWILQRETFTRWQTEDSAVTVLYGDPGAGKTFLTSKVIDFARDNACEDEAVAFFYCKRDENNRRNPADILRSILRQLSSSVGSKGLIHPSHIHLSSRLAAEGATFDVPTCKDLIANMIGDYSRTTIILDALDECDRAMRSELMTVLDNLARECSRLRIFLSSRTDDDIVRHFRSKPVIQIQATDNQDDISSFVDDSLSQDPRWKDLSQDLQQEIKSKLRRGSNGMFQWAALQVHQLVRLRAWKEPSIRAQLATAPSSLKGAYDFIWNNIEQMSDYEAQLAKRAFRWVLCSFGSLKTKALSVAMQIDPDSDEVDDLSVLDDEEIAGICGNLLVYDQQFNVWRFSHLSAREYIEEHHYDVLGAHRFAAMCSLKVFTVGLQAYPGLKEDSKPTEYIFEYGLQHAHEVDHTNATENSRLKFLLKRFLGSPQETSFAYQHWRYHSREGKELSGLSPFPAMSKFGLFHLLKDWWEGLGNELDVCDSDCPSPLSLAIMYGREEIWRFLMGKKVRLDQGSPTPLKAAIHAGHLAAFDALLKAHTDVNEIYPYGPEDTPLKLSLKHHSGAENGYLYTHRLLKAGADVNLSTPEGTALEYAAQNSTEKSIRMLMKAGAKVSSPGFLLYLGARERDIEAIRVAWKHGAAVNDEWDGRSQLIHAMRSDCPDSVRLLLDMGASVNTVGSKSPGTALATAVQRGSFDMFKLLMDAGAYINGNNGKESPLSVALQSGRRDWICMVIRAGADVNQVLPLAGFPTPLAHAAAKGRADLVRILLDAGADPTISVDAGLGSALAVAAFDGNISICRLLLDQKRVDVNQSQKGFYRNAFFALAHGHLHYRNQYPGRLDHAAVRELFFEDGWDIYTPRYLSLGPLSPLIHAGLLAGLRVEAAWMFHPGDCCVSLAPEWAFIMWELESGARPRLSLHSRLGQVGFPRRLPPAANIVAELKPVSTLQSRSLFLVIAIRGNRSELQFGRVRRRRPRVLQKA